jgi:hypothetical protein
LWIYIQGEKEAGMDRLDDVAEFRVARSLHAHVLKQSAETGKQLKPSQFFGRRFPKATQCWPGEGSNSLRAKAEADLRHLDQVD